MTTTFKGVRQPIAKKPTANTSILEQLLKRAEQNAEAANYLYEDTRIPVPTAGYVYTYKGRSSADEPFDIFSQGTVQNPNEVVNYNGLWIVASYLHLMTNGDQTNTLLIKALISYLYNNASVICADTLPSVASKYFVDVVMYDIVSKLGMSDSLYDLISAHPTEGTVYEQMLKDFSTKSFADVWGYLTHDKPLTGLIKTTLVTNQIGGIVKDEPVPAKVTFPDDIDLSKLKNLDDSKDDFIGSSYWISDKVVVNSNEADLQGFGALSLTSRVFNTKGSSVSNIKPSIKWVYQGFSYSADPSPTAKQNGWSKDGKVSLSVSLYTGATDVNVEIYSPRVESGNYPKSNINGLGEYKKVGEFKNLKTYFAGQQSVLMNGVYLFDATGLNLPSDRTYFSVARYTIDNQPVYELSKSLITGNINGGSQVNQADATRVQLAPGMVNPTTTYTNGTNTAYYYGNSPAADPTLVSEDLSIPMILGFAKTVSKYTTQGPNFVYGKSYGDPFKPNRTDNMYQADYLGAISNGNSYIAFIAIAKEDELTTKKADQRSDRSYVDNVILRGPNGDGKTPQKWTIVTPEKDLTQYVPKPKKYIGGQTKISGWYDPLSVVTTTSNFGMRTLNGKTRMHEGIDLAASVGTSIYAALPGKVVFAGPNDPDGYGRLVILSHETQGLSTLYGHISVEKVSTGQTVKAGDIIALSGNEGSAKQGGAHLHFEVRTGIATSYDNYFDKTALKPVDPKPYFAVNKVQEDQKTINSAETEANILEIKNILKGKGWSQIEVAAALGNIHQETSGTFNPYATNQKDLNNYPSLGLIQWNGQYIAGGTKDKEKAFNVICRTVQTQLTYLTEGAWKSSSDKFRDAVKNKLSGIDTSGAGNKVNGLSADQLKAYVAAYIFADIVEVCAGCNEGAEASSEGFKNYHTGTKAIAYETWGRSKKAVEYFKRMSNSGDKIKW